MTTDPAQRDYLRRLVETALHLTPQERLAYLETACPRDPALRDDVLRMIALYESGPTSHEGPAAPGHGRRSHMISPAAPALGEPDRATDTNPNPTTEAEPDVISRDSLTAPDWTFAVGDVVAGRFAVRRVVGRGGMGEVYEADDRELREHVALKTIRRADRSTETVERFRREIHLARRISHPNVCRVHDVFRHRTAMGETLVLSMEFLEGETLRDRLGRDPRIDRKQVLAIARDAAAALAAIHTANIVHRDLKSSNIMLVPDRREASGARAVVMDFGLAKPESGAMPEYGLTTSTGRLLGTPAYVAPEQLQGGPLGPWTDVYAFGVVFFEMACGRLPFQGDSPAAIAIQRLDHAPPHPGTLVADLPDGWEPLILRCLARRPEERFQSADALLDALRALHTGPLQTADGADNHPSAHGRRKRVAAMAGVAATLIAGAALAWQWPLATPVGDTAERAVSTPGVVQVPREDTAAPPNAATSVGETSVGPQPAPVAPADVAGADVVPASALTDTDTLVLADITNTTGDTVFDHTLREALAYELEESRFLKILGDEPMRQALRLMGRSPDERITNGIAREICVRRGEKAVVSGSITSLGTTYVLALHAVRCETGDALAREQAEAVDKERVLQALSQAARRMRAKLGESLGAIEKPDRNLTHVTTTSLAAFQAYALGLSPVRQGAWLAAIPFFRRATELDPDFALAWLRLGQMYGNSGDRTSMLRYYGRAFALRDRVTEREALPITSAYYGVTGESDKAAEIYGMWVRTYTRDAYPHYRLGQNHRRLGQLEDALREYRAAVRLEPRAIYYSELLDTYGLLGRFDDAKAVAEAASAGGLDSPDLHLSLLRIAFVQGDDAAAEKEARWFVNKPEEYRSLSAQAENLYVLGQRRKADVLRQRAFELRKRQNLTAVPQRPANVRDPLFGECPGVNEQGPALLMAYCGDAAAAHRAVDELITRGADSNDAQVLYLRGLAHLGQRNAAEAAKAFREVIDHRPLNWGPFYPLSFVGLARSALLGGDLTAARDAYQNFLAIWSDADADIPVLVEARKQYAALK